MAYAAGLVKRRCARAMKCSERWSAVARGIARLYCRSSDDGITESKGSQDRSWRLPFLNWVGVTCKSRKKDLEKFTAPENPQLSAILVSGQSVFMSKRCACAMRRRSRYL